MKMKISRWACVSVSSVRGLVTVGCVAVFLGLAVSSQAALLWTENFENDTVGADPDNPPWNSLQEPADTLLDITNAMPWPNDTKVGHVVDTATDNSAAYFRATSLPGVDHSLVTVSFDAYLNYPTLNPGAIYVDLLDADSVTNRPVRSVGLVTASGFRSNHWHHFDLIANFTGSATNYNGVTLNNEKYDLWMDGKRVKANSNTFPGDYADGIDGLAFLSWKADLTDYTFDNIEIRDTTYVYDDLLGIQTTDEIDDDFDDGDLLLNPSGVGHGFVKGSQSSGTFNENASESAVRFDITSGNFAKRTLASRDEFVLEDWTRDFAWYMDVVGVSNGTANIDARILCTVMSDDTPQTGTIEVEPWGTGEGGIWVYIDAIDAGSSNLFKLYLYATDDSNIPSDSTKYVKLGNFEFNQDDGQPLAVFLSLNRATVSSQEFEYDLRVTNNTGVVGTLSGTTDAGIEETDLLADELAGGVFVSFSVNNRDSGSAAIDLERITVSKRPPRGMSIIVK